MALSADMRFPYRWNEDDQCTSFLCLVNPQMSLTANLTQDIDIIVDADPSDARSLLLQAHSGFRLSQNNKLIFTGAEEDVVIELLRGGRDRGS